MMKKKCILMIVAILLILAIAFWAQWTTVKGINAIQNIEKETLLTFTNNGALKDEMERDLYLNQIDQYLSSKKKSLLIRRIDRNSDSITIVFYTGVHYTVFPLVEGSK